MGYSEVKKCETISTKNKRQELETLVFYGAGDECKITVGLSILNNYYDNCIKTIFCVIIHLGVMDKNGYKSYKLFPIYEW